MTLNNKIMATSGLSLALIIAITLVGCSGNDQPVQYAPQPPVIVNQPAPAPVQQQAAPVVVQAAPAHDSGLGTALAAGAIGYMAGSSNRQQAPAYQPVPRVVHRTTVIKQKVIVQQPKQSFRATKTVSLSKKGRR